MTSVEGFVPEVVDDLAEAAGGLRGLAEALKALLDVLSELDYLFDYIARLVVTPLGLPRVVPDLGNLISLVPLDVEKIIHRVHPPDVSDLHYCLQIVLQPLVPNAFRFVVEPLRQNHCFVGDLDVVHPPL
jgi:hypothetical protein